MTESLSSRDEPGKGLFNAQPSEVIVVAVKEQNHREYIRHPSHIPLELRPRGAREQLNLRLNNVSVGGLCIESPYALDEGTVVRLKISCLSPVFKVEGIVQRCRYCDGHYELGVEFLDPDDAFRVRMVEQICHIEDYRRAQRKQGRKISRNQASREWIAMHGHKFPALPH